MILLSFLRYWLTLFNSVFILQVFNHTAELTTSIWVTTKKAKEETETHPITAKSKINVLI